jgi:hypothetical protein
MDNEPYHDLTHNEACDLIADFKRREGYTVEREFTLPNGRIADVITGGSTQNFEIIEVKTILRASLIEMAMLKYFPHCHRLWIAIPELDFATIEAAKSGARWAELQDRVGLIGVYRDALVEVRRAEHHAMHPSNYAAVRRMFGET